MKPENENELRDDEEEEFEFDDALLDELEVQKTKKLNKVQKYGLLFIESW